MAVFDAWGYTMGEAAFGDDERQGLARIAEMPVLRRLWRDYGLSITLVALFLGAWSLQTWTGWVEFRSEQAADYETEASLRRIEAKLDDLEKRSRGV